MPWNQTFVHTSGPIKGDWQDSVPVAPLILAFVYNLFATFYVFLNARPVHSILEGIVDFLVWAVLIPGVVLAAWGGAFNLWTSPTVGAGGMIICDMDRNALSRECFPELYQIGELELAGVVFAIPSTTVHIASNLTLPAGLGLYTLSFLYMAVWKGARGAGSAPGDRISQD
ncbi:hypothetical protein T310_3583 [Rasamsonia emersonii CBS 393.64]|uniref:Uncharacterized protein n=1 Tax=Rasamsonia emersonii (strain ATCC 16479 / CBS 393.64 / IMI 116815) TaxID=1408163 RepID=A0A0F4YVQ0_RASE3|nr:hypothetical protein T310_3583 [Rasamsonia emersonii CBS 393.64]KKA22377.1 hypothetical protein T310_3583 [Rasamsonia emersonii CBS 393.64]